MVHVQHRPSTRVYPPDEKCPQTHNNYDGKGPRRWYGGMRASAYGRALRGAMRSHRGGLVHCGGGGSADRDSLSLALENHLRRGTMPVVFDKPARDPIALRTG